MLGVPPMVIMAACAQSPRAGNGRPRGVTHNAARYQANRSCDNGSRHRAQRRIAYPLPSLHTYRYKRSSNYNTAKYLLHVPFPTKDILMTYFD